jgi:hypothetical protein
LEVTVDNVEQAKLRLVKNGCEIIKDEPDFPRCYVKDPFGLIYKLDPLAPLTSKASIGRETGLGEITPPLSLSVYR